VKRAGYAEAGVSRNGVEKIPGAGTVKKRECSAGNARNAGEEAVAQ